MEIASGYRLWVAAIVMAAVAPPLFFAWRERRFRISMLNILIVLGLAGPLCLWLRPDLVHWKQIAAQSQVAPHAIMVQVVLILSWIVCLVVDGLPVLIGSFRRRL